MATNYVLGFMFSKGCGYVALIKKNRPQWQSGRLNGIGGHVQEGETPIKAMVREFKEETGMDTAESQWRGFGAMIGNNDGGWVCNCFVTRGDVVNLKTMTDEPLVIKNIANMGVWRSEAIENIPWLVHMALDALEDGRPRFSTIDYP